MNKLKSIKSLTKLGEEWVEAASIDMKNRLIKTDKKKRKPLNKRKKKTTRKCTKRPFALMVTEKKYRELLDKKSALTFREKRTLGNALFYTVDAIFILTKMTDMEYV